jgi:hypothetical protein
MSTDAPVLSLVTMGEQPRGPGADRQPVRPPGTAPPPASTVPEPGARGTSVWVVWVAVGGVLLLVSGAFHLAQGVGALLTDERFLLPGADPVLDLGTTAWGWLHATVGAVLVVAGLLVFAGRAWARAVGVVVAVLSALTALSSLTSSPVWVTAIVALDALVVVALTRHGKEITAGA